MTSYSTTFSGANEDPISEGGAWISGQGVSSDLEVLSGVCQASAAALSSIARLATSSPGATIGENQYAKGTVGAFSTAGHYLTLQLRMSTGADGDCYSWNCQAGTTNGKFQILDDQGGADYVYTQIGALHTISLAANDTVEFRAQGRILSVLKNGALVAAVADGTYASGQPGLGTYVTTTPSLVTWTAWEGGDFVAAGPIVAGAVESLRTDTSDPWTWSHNQGTVAPKGVLVGIMHGTSATDHVVGVTYGGVALTRAQRNVDTATEPGAAEWWFVGSGIPTGTQTVSVDLSSGTTDDLHGVSITLDASANLEVVDVDGLSDTNAANPSVTLNYGGRACRAFAALYSGLTSPTAITPGTGCVALTTLDLAGTFTSVALTQVAAGTADFAIGATAAADDVAYAAVAIGEVATAYVLTASGGSYGLTGTAATPKVGRKVSAASDSYSLSGTAAALRRGLSLIAGGDSYGLTGVAALLEYGRAVQAGTGSYGATGSAAGLLFTHKVVAGSGSYALAGSDATLDYWGSSVPTLPQAWVDTTMPAPRSGATTHVCTSSAQFATALTNAVLGDIIELQAGTVFQGPFTLPNKTPAAHVGNPYDSEWITIRSSAHASLPAEGTRVGPSDASNMPKVQSDNANQSAIFTSGTAHHYRFVGVEIRILSGSAVNTLVFIGSSPAETSLSQLPHHLVFDRCYMHGTPTAGIVHGIVLHCATAAVIDSYMSDIVAETDSQCIVSWNGPGPYKIVNNYLEASGENVLFGGSNATIVGVIPSDIEIRRNHFFKPLRWKTTDPSWDGSNWAIKNLFELKAGKRVLLDGNILENCWASGQSGYAILLTALADEFLESAVMYWNEVSDITMTNNWIKNTGRGLQLGRYTGTFASDRILLGNNLFTAMAASASFGDGLQILITNGSHDVTVEHNTIINPSSDGSLLVGETGPNNNLIYRDNIQWNGGFGVSGGGFGSAALDANFPDAIFEKNTLIGPWPSSQGVTTGHYSGHPDNFFPQGQADVGFVNYAGGDYALTAASDYHNAATDGTDVGVDMVALNLALSGPPAAVAKHVLIRLS